MCVLFSIQALASKAGAAPKESGATEAEAARSASEESSSPLGISVGIGCDKIPPQPVDMGDSVNGGTPKTPQNDHL